MKVRRLLAAATIVVLTACGGHTPTPLRSAAPSIDPVFRFAPVARYVIDATLGSTTHTEQIRITIGATQTWTTYIRDHKTQCETPPDPDRDQVVPMYFNMINTSPAGDTPANIAALAIIAVDDTGLTGRQFSMGINTTTDCASAVPARSVTETGPSDALITVLETQTRTPVASGKEITWPATIVITSHGEEPLPMTALFLRLTPFKGYPSTVPYAITRLTATGAVGSVITEGTYKGVFFVPLVPGTSPCTTIGRSAKMNCGTDLTPPK